MTVVVTDLAARHEAEWRRLFLGYIAFYGTHVPEEVIGLTWQRLLGREDGMLAFVAEAGSNGKLAGIVHAVLHRSTWSATRYCYLEDLYVDPRHRGGGTGRALVERVYAAADAAGCTRTYWVTQEGNAAARRLYDALAEKAPFVQYRRV